MRKGVVNKKYSYYLYACMLRENREHCEGNYDDLSLPN
jgi:hypothetical protein